MPGESVEAVFVLNNKSERAVALRYIKLTLSPEISVVDPASDGLDNDGDEETDGQAEAFDRRDADGAEWRFDENRKRTLGAGESVTMRLRLDIAPDALPGSVGLMTLTAGAIPAGARPTRPRETERAITVPLASPVLSLSSDMEGQIGIGETVVFDGKVTLPGGILPDTRITLTLPPAMANASITRYRTGSAVICEDDTGPVFRDQEAALSLGRCTVDADASVDERSLFLSVSTDPATAPSGSSDAFIADWRRVSVYLGLWSGEELLDGKVRDMRLHGPHPIANVELIEKKELRVGDFMPVRITVTNAGDRALDAPRLILRNPETFRCDSVRIGPSGDPVPCTDDTIALDTIETGDTRVLTVRLKLRRDARIGANTGPSFALAATGIDARAVGVPRLSIAQHDGPALRILDAGDWAGWRRYYRDGWGYGPAAPDRYAAARSLSRRDPAAGPHHRRAHRRSGRPRLPRHPRPDLSITALEGGQTGEITGYSTRTGTLWSYYTMGYDLREATRQTDQNRRFNADFDVDRCRHFRHFRRSCLGNRRRDDGLRAQHGRRAIHGSKF